MLTSININLYPQKNLKFKRHLVVGISIMITLALLSLIIILRLFFTLQEKSKYLSHQIDFLQQKIVPVNSSTNDSKSPQPHQMLKKLEQIENAHIAGITINKITMFHEKWFIEGIASTASLVNQFNNTLSADLIELKEEHNGPQYQFKLQI